MTAANTDKNRTMILHWQPCREKRVGKLFKNNDFKHKNQKRGND